MASERDPRTGWNRLEDTLITIKPGETISIEALVTETGLTAKTVETVMAALIKTELFERTPENHFVRRRLMEVRDVDPPPPGQPATSMGAPK
jgi:hypothetical protein